MIFSFLSIILAILGLSFLIFIHELGHYFAAKRQGMRVETFSIGLGRPIYKWKHNGTLWQIGWLLFGGYVKIAGMENDKPDDIRNVEGGFFSKSPLARIKVSLAGPLVNIIFAFLAFAILWALGGREKPFSEYTKRIGWVDPKSELYTLGIRPGDEIVSYGNQLYQGAKDHLYAPMTSKNHLEVRGNKINPLTMDKTPFDLTIKPYPHPASIDKEIVTSGILQPASYLIYDRLPNGKENPLPEGSPLLYSGIEYGDRIVWLDGEMIYSLTQLNHLLNESRALLTVKRGDEILLKRAPRVTADELRLDSTFREELTDWQFEAELNNVKFMKLYVLPYALSADGTVEQPVAFIDQDKEKEAFPDHPFSALEESLKPGDRIIAVDGTPVSRSFEILKQIQQHQVHVIIEKGVSSQPMVTWNKADELFNQQVHPKDLLTLISQIGLSSKNAINAGNLVMLKPVVPKPRSEFALGPENRAHIILQREEKRKELESISDPDKRAQAIEQLENHDKQLLLGIPLSGDQLVNYNPNPVQQFDGVVSEIWNTLGALFTGSLNPKFMSGPVGIVSLVQQQSLVGLKEALYWLGLISLNLGILNLLPIPVLDGGTICFSLFEWITGIKLKPKTMERLIIPFALLLIGFFIFLTYNDVMRLMGGFFKK